ncbi:hypothetical protein [Nonomuraea terrae]|uniref:hypothetical protein n=1 Tax=Nonomuraea terrae TaxID=2530383 RepID=UPI0014046F60|nr:hypothetical protein [Nonomuraea terrae]
MTVYLPEGERIDVWTGHSLDGGREVTPPAELDRPTVLRAAAHRRRPASAFAD